MSDHPPASGTLVGYPCPECGYDGPHTVFLAGLDDDADVLECGSCTAETDLLGPVTQRGDVYVVGPGDHDPQVDTDA